MRKHAIFRTMIFAFSLFSGAGCNQQSGSSSVGWRKNNLSAAGLVMAMDLNVNLAHRFNELPDETQEFLSQLHGDDIETLKDGLRLVIAMRTAGRLMKWMIVAVVGTFIGAVMLYENILKVLNWINQAK